MSLPHLSDANSKHAKEIVRGIISLSLCCSICIVCFCAYRLASQQVDHGKWSFPQRTLTVIEIVSPDVDAVLVKRAQSD